MAITRGNKAMVKATGAALLAHANAKGKIPHVDRGSAQAT